VVGCFNNEQVVVGLVVVRGSSLASGSILSHPSGEWLGALITIREQVVSPVVHLAACILTHLRVVSC
jgi:hypothetical protein